MSIMKKMYRESYELSDELVGELQSIAAEEFLANEMYNLAERAMKGKKQHLLSEIAKENGKDELEDHFENLCDWMQSKEIPVPTSYDDMVDMAQGTLFNFDDGESTEEIIENLILSEQEAIAHYEDVLDMEDCKYDLRVMLCGFLKDEREHLKALMDVRDEMGVSTDAGYEIDDGGDDDEVEVNVDDEEEPEDDEEIDDGAIRVDVGDEEDDEG